MNIPSLTPVTSSNIEAVGHDGTDLFIQFKDGGLYRFKNVDAGVYNGLIAAGSAGKYFHAQIKGKFDSEQVKAGEPTPDAYLDAAEARFVESGLSAFFAEKRGMKSFNAQGKTEDGQRVYTLYTAEGSIIESGTFEALQELSRNGLAPAADLKPITDDSGQNHPMMAGEGQAAGNNQNTGDKTGESEQGQSKAA